MDLHIREQRLPGIGHRYEVVLGRMRRLVIVVQNNGGREIAVFDEDADQPALIAALTHDQAVAVAALLTGARFSLDTTADERTSGDEVEIGRSRWGSSRRR